MGNVTVNTVRFVVFSSLFLLSTVSSSTHQPRVAATTRSRTLKGAGSSPAARSGSLRGRGGNPQALVVLGKALFWDVQVGRRRPNGACATCTFHAGADHRVTQPDCRARRLSAGSGRPRTPPNHGRFPVYALPIHQQ